MEDFFGKQHLLFSHPGLFFILGEFTTDLTNALCILVVARCFNSLKLSQYMFSTMEKSDFVWKCHLFTNGEKQQTVFQGNHDVSLTNSTNKRLEASYLQNILYSVKEPQPQWWYTMKATFAFFHLGHYYKYSIGSVPLPNALWALDFCSWLK